MIRPAKEVNCHPVALCMLRSGPLWEDFQSQLPALTYSGSWQTCTSLVMRPAQVVPQILLHISHMPGKLWMRVWELPGACNPGVQECRWATQYST